MEVYPTSYVDDIIILVTSTDKRTQVDNLANLVVSHFKQTAAEHGIILADEKEDSLTCRKGKRALKTVKILGVIIDNTLQFRKHAEYRAGKGKQLWGALYWLGNTTSGMSPQAWRQLYTGMVRQVMT